MTKLATPILVFDDNGGRIVVRVGDNVHVWDISSAASDKPPFWIEYIRLWQRELAEVKEELRIERVTTEEMIASGKSLLIKLEQAESRLAEADEVTDRMCIAGVKAIDIGLVDYGVAEVYKAMRAAIAQ
jgi:hypothetical protein